MNAKPLSHCSAQRNDRKVYFVPPLLLLIFLSFQEISSPALAAENPWFARLLSETLLKAAIHVKPFGGIRSLRRYDLERFMPGMLNSAIEEIVLKQPLTAEELSLLSIAAREIRLRLTNPKELETLLSEQFGSLSSTQNPEILRVVEALNKALNTDSRFNSLTEDSSAAGLETMPVDNYIDEDPGNYSLEAIRRDNLEALRPDIKKLFDLNSPDVVLMLLRSHLHSAPEEAHEEILAQFREHLLQWSKEDVSRIARKLLIDLRYQPASPKPVVVKLLTQLFASVPFRSEGSWPAEFPPSRDSITALHTQFQNWLITQLDEILLSGRLPNPKHLPPTDLKILLNAAVSAGDRRIIPSLRLACNRLTAYGTEEQRRLALQTLETLREKISNDGHF
ncbi:MAG: hypothetical protein HY391_02995 [Deltaproteobacteria bacterium]|nr:hypothetical protein [Deltaproteobacteria bacterium]